MVGATSIRAAGARIRGRPPCIPARLKLAENPARCPSQVKRSIRWEEILIAVFGGVLGLVVGLVLGTAVVIAIGEGLKLAIPTGQLITYLIAAAIGGVLAAILPARRGAKTNILDAIAYE